MKRISNEELTRRYRRVTRRPGPPPDEQAARFFAEFTAEVIAEIEDCARARMRAGHTTLAIEFICTSQVPASWVRSRVSWRQWWSRCCRGLRPEELAGCYLARVKLLNLTQWQEVLQIAIPGEWRYHVDLYRTPVLAAIKGFDLGAAKQLRVFAAEGCESRILGKYYLSWGSR